MQSYMAFKVQVLSRSSNQNIVKLYMYNSLNKTQILKTTFPITWRKDYPEKIIEELKNDAVIHIINMDTCIRLLSPFCNYRPRILNYEII